MGLFGIGQKKKGRGFFQGLLGGQQKAAKVGSNKPASKPDVSRVLENPGVTYRLKADAVEADRQVTIQVDARHIFDITALRVSIAQIRGVVNGEAFLAASSGDKGLAEAATAFAEGVLSFQNNSYSAIVHHDNITALSNFFVDIINILDASARRLLPRHATLLKRLHMVVTEASGLADSCSKPGWMARLAKAENIETEFSRLHGLMLALLRSEGLDHCADGRLGEPKYTDAGAAVREMLKTFGKGSISAGINRLVDDQAAADGVAKVLGTPMAHIIREARLEAFATGGAQLIHDASDRQVEFLKVFKEYAGQAQHSISGGSFETLLYDMGLLDCVPEVDRSAAARNALVSLDLDYDGALSYDEFVAFYGRYPVAAIRIHLRITGTLELERRLYETFSSFTGYTGSGQQKYRPELSTILSPAKHRPGGDDELTGNMGLDYMRFAKLCRDTGLISHGVTAQQADILYAGVKPRAARRMDFDHFLVALALIADRRGQLLHVVARMITMAGGATLRCTRTGYVKLHDDPSMRTGVYARGGPSLGAVNLDLPSMVNRSKEPPALSPPSGQTTPRPSVTHPESPKLATAGRMGTQGPVTPGRGAPLLPVARMAKSASPTGPPAVFGRTMAPRAAHVANNPRGKPKKSKKQHADRSEATKLEDCMFSLSAQENVRDNRSFDKTNNSDEHHDVPISDLDADPLVEDERVWDSAGIDDSRALTSDSELEPTSETNAETVKAADGDGARCIENEHNWNVETSEIERAERESDEVEPDAEDAEIKYYTEEDDAGKEG